MTGTPSVFCESPRLVLLLELLHEFNRRMPNDTHIGAKCNVFQRIFDHYIKKLVIIK